MTFITFQPEWILKNDNGAIPMGSWATANRTMCLLY